MASRKLQRIKALGPDTIAKLNKKQLLTAKDLFANNELELIEQLDVSQAEVQHILGLVASTIVPPPVTMWDLLTQQTSSTAGGNLSLSSQIPELKLIKGTITEIVGPAGMGKTQACMMMCVCAALPLEFGGLGGGVVYIDTEKTFAPGRVVEMAKQRHPALAGFPDALADLTSRILVYQESSTAAILQRLNNLEAVLIEKNIKLLIVDSIAAPVRQQYDAEHLSERQDFLGAIASKVKYLAENVNICVLITNQVTTRYGDQSSGSYLHPALGVGWAHSVNTRFLLEHAGEAKKVRVGKSPLFPMISFHYVISAGGLDIDPTQLSPDATENSNVTEMKVAQQSRRAAPQS